ncbi:unnamed protein product [Sphagnum troendelagicum]|uniref:Uncharacterized protein n=1 Tax=Sphagnum troendelagicum TaxID=128251 RepID=A0ABP0V5A0_9BRYO
MVLTWEGVGAAYKRRKMKDRQESTEASSSSSISTPPPPASSYGIRMPDTVHKYLPYWWLICGFHFGVLFRHCSRVFFKWEMMSYAGSTCEVKQPWIT